MSKNGDQFWRWNVYRACLYVRDEKLEQELKERVRKEQVVRVFQRFRMFSPNPPGPLST